MKDEFTGTEWFEWIGGLLERSHDGVFARGSREDGIMAELKAGWGTRPTVALLRGLSAAHGDAAIATAVRFFEHHLVGEWAEIGRAEARPGTEISDFVRVLWKGLTPEQGYEYSYSGDEERTVFRVTKCPVHELAKRTGLTDWLHALGCNMDYLTTRKFSPALGFERSKTLIEGHDCCDHTYFRIGGGKAE